MKPSHTIAPVFDDPNLVSIAGLVPVLRLAERAGLHDELESLTVDSPNAGVKASAVIAGMLAGADSIDDMNVLRHGAADAVFTGIRAPSTLGTFLRSFTHGHVQQLAAVNRKLLTSLTAHIPPLQPAASPDAMTFIDIDDTIDEVHGYAKQGAAYGYTGIKGLNLLIAAVSTAESAPLIVESSLRRGNTNSIRGAARLATLAINDARRLGAAGQVMVRADSAYYSHKFVSAASGNGTLYSVTACQNAAVRRAISSIDEAAWTPIEYTNAVYDDTENRWISDAEIAEIPFTAFTRHNSDTPIPCRLVVRRIKRLGPAPQRGAAQGELFTAYRFHAFITNSDLDTATADAVHRDHAIIEQVFAELKGNALAHLPSGKYAANAAWAALAVIAFNLARAAATAAGMPRIRWSTVRTRIITLAGRLARRSRRLVLHLPKNWAWTHEWEQLWAAANSPPPALTT